ncbi:MAG TPA: hypothetical protein VNF27_05160 [Candidatus Binataceae bacterium]|nr:hypothetical protein [Candidatus Binataceae bacterium]
MANSTPIYEAFVKLGTAIARLPLAESEPPVYPWSWEPLKGLATEIDAIQAKHDRVLQAIRHWLIKASLKFGNPSNASTDQDFVAALS